MKNYCSQSVLQSVLQSMLQSVLQSYLQEKMRKTFKFKQSVPGYNGFSVWVLKSDIYS